MLNFQLNLNENWCRNDWYTAIRRLRRRRRRRWAWRCLFIHSFISFACLCVLCSFIVSRHSKYEILKSFYSSKVRCVRGSLHLISNAAEKQRKTKKKLGDPKRTKKKQNTTKQLKKNPKTMRSIRRIDILKVRLEIYAKIRLRWRFSASSHHLINIEFPFR